MEDRGYECTFQDHELAIRDHGTTFRDPGATIVDSDPAIRVPVAEKGTQVSAELGSFSLEGDQLPFIQGKFKATHFRVHD
jgi:hypothetical protein